MTMKLRQPFPAGRLCRELGLSLIGPDREISEICSLDSLAAQGLSFAMKTHAPAPGAAGTLFGHDDHAGGDLTVIKSEHPRLDFIRAQHLLEKSPGFVEDPTAPDIHPTAVIGRHAVIENGVTIGEGTRVGSLVVIKSGTRIGRYCVIKSGAVIGESGFGFERGWDTRPLKMIHLGGVRIGDHVEVGSLTTVCRGALGDTVLEDYVKLDDHVHVAHNCRVGEGAMITACAELSGSVKVGRNAWLAPNCSVMQKLELGAGCVVGLGAVVVRSVEPGATVFGNPAKTIPSSAPPHSSRPPKA